MDFTPLGHFDPHAPLQPALIAQARGYAAALPLVPPGTLDRVYGHWTVGHYAHDFPDYNGSVRYDGGAFFLDVSHDPRDNARGVNDNPPAAHTYRRNTGAFGITIDAMVFANEHDFGPEPLTLTALEWLCAGIAGVAHAYGIDLTGRSTGTPYAGEPTFLTHAEAADRPGSPAQYAPYGPGATCERWDLASFVPFPAGLAATATSATMCGDALRLRAHRYKAALG